MNIDEFLEQAGEDPIDMIDFGNAGALMHAERSLEAEKIAEAIIHAEEKESNLSDGSKIID